MNRLANTFLLVAALSPAVRSQDAALAASAPADRSSPAKQPQVPFAGLANLELTIADAGLHAHIDGPSAGFFGVVLLSDSPEQTHFLTGLPPILSNYFVLGFGLARGDDLDLWAANPAPCSLARVYAQAVILDGQGLGFSGLVPLALPTCKSDTGDAVAGK